MYAIIAIHTRNRSTKYSHFFHIRITSLHQGSANRLFRLEQRPGFILPSAPAFVNLPHPACGLCGGPFRLNRFAREARANHYAPLGARRSARADGPAGAGGHVGWHRLYSLFNGGRYSSAIKRRTSVGPFPRWFFLLIYRGLLAPFVRLRWRCYPLWPSARADMASRMVRTPRR